MRCFFLTLLITAAIVVSCMGLNAQQTSPVTSTSVKGLVRDTVKNLTVKAATAALYRSDSTLISYQLTNNYGEFIFKNLAPNEKFYIEISHLGYRLLRQAFTSAGTSTPLDLKTLVLIPSDIELDAVKIMVPPVSMNGDTLEFNPAAFKLDSNAVVEDLLRKIPNVVLWGDGSITVNGRVVKKVLVNGKEFFGGDFKTATQNIPKNVVQKVQVYNQRPNENNLMDSTLAMNIQLKKGKDTGYFGKMSGGYGTDERYETDANLNAFTPRMQLGLAGAANNINKAANNVKTLIANSTFKGVGATMDYQSDFRIAGINRSIAGGATYAYDLLKSASDDDKKMLTANYFLQNSSNQIVFNSLTSTSIRAADQVFDTNITSNNTESTRHSFESSYQSIKGQRKLTISQNLNVNTGETTDQSLRNASDQLNVPTSTNNTLSNGRFNNKSFGFTASVDKPDNLTSIWGNASVRYSLNISDNTSERSDMTAFRSFITPADNRDFNRRYASDGNSVNQQLFAELRSLKRLIFGFKQIAGIDFGIKNELRHSYTNTDNQAADFNIVTGAFESNAYLSNITRTSVLQETPGLKISKNFKKILSNRYAKTLSIQGTASQKFIFQENRSDRALRNINRNYSNFVPSADLNYSNHQYGEFRNTVSLNYNTEIQIPGINQLAPLTDSTNFYNLQRGNINLKESVSRTFDLSFSHEDQHGSNTLNYNFRASMSLTDDFITDSTLIDKQNRRTVYLVNTDGYHSTQVNGSVGKALKFSSGTLQLSLNGSASLTNQPGFINSAFTFSKNLTTGGGGGVYYDYKDKLSVQSVHRLTFNRSRQNAFNTSYSGTTTGQDFAAAFKPARKFTLNSNISFNTNKSAGQNAINYTIWNASATLRLMKGNNAEFKFSALDLLHQNNSVLNYGGPNSFTVGTRNLLQQYFMATLSYFPRKFGK